MEHFLDKTYADTWNTRTAKLGEMSYAEYLLTDHWQSIKRKAMQRPNYKKCEFCDVTKTDLHHTSYKWLFTNEELRVIISLCRFHHHELHALAKRENISVRRATNRLRKQYKSHWAMPNRA